MRANQLWIWTLLLAAVALGTWRANANANNAQQTPSPAVIAVVDLQEAIKTLDQRTAQEQALQQFIESQNEKIKKIGAELEQVRNEIDLLVPDSPEYRRKVEQAWRLRADLEVQKNVSDQLIDRRRAEAFAKLFENIRDAASRVAERAGYDLVLSNDAGAELPEGSESQVRSVMINRRVLYAADELDITDQVVRMMNNEWAAGQAGAN